MTQLIARVEVSGAALVSKSRVGEVRSDIARDRDTWKKALQSPSLTREQLKDIEYGYTQKIANTEQKIKDLKDIESRLALLTGKSPREVDALREIK